MQIKGTLMLLGAAFFWGTTFVAQLTGMDNLEPFSYAAGRYLIGFLSLMILLIYTRRSRAKERRQKNYQRGFLIGLLIGLVLFVATSMQQIALQYSTAGKAAFITCLYIVFVPLGAKFLGLAGRTACNRRLIPFGSRRRIFNTARRRNFIYQFVPVDGAHFADRPIRLAG